MAPMAGYTDRAFRKIVKKMGAALVFAEFLSADGLVRENSKTLELLQFDKNERPVGIQIFGNDPMVMAGAAQIVETFQPDVIDLNFGCPVPKVIKKGAGAALLKNLNKLEIISKAVVNAVSIPVTAKIRSGWDKNSIVVEEAAQRIENAGIQAITVHPRTRSMGYSGKADWELIAKVKNKLTIPVIGNGDIWCSEDSFRMMEETHCDFVMVARGALGNPWIFKEIQSFQFGKKSNVNDFKMEWLDIVFEHLDLAKRFNGEKRAVKEMRKFLAFYLKGKPGASHIRHLIHTLSSIDDIKETFINYYNDNEEYFLKELNLSH